MTATIATLLVGERFPHLKSSFLKVCHYKRPYVSRFVGFSKVFPSETVFKVCNRSARFLRTYGREAWPQQNVCEYKRFRIRVEGPSRDRLTRLDEISPYRGRHLSRVHRIKTSQPDVATPLKELISLFEECCNGRSLRSNLKTKTHSHKFPELVNHRHKLMVTIWVSRANNHVKFDVCDRERVQVFALPGKNRHSLSTSVSLPTQVDVFTLDGVPSVGDIEKLRIWHDNSGLDPSWKLRSVSVQDRTTGDVYLFNCYSLLSKDEGSTLDDIKCTGKAAPSGTVGRCLILVL